MAVTDLGGAGYIARKRSLTESARPSHPTSGRALRLQGRFEFPRPRLANVGVLEGAIWRKSLVCEIFPSCLSPKVSLASATRLTATSLQEFVT